MKTSQLVWMNMLQQDTDDNIKYVTDRITKYSINDPLQRKKLEDIIDAIKKVTYIGVRNDDEPLNANVFFDIVQIEDMAIENETVKTQVDKTFEAHAPF